jgi:hypothetical protein
MTDSNDHPADDNGQEQPQQPPRRGGMRFQDAENTVPREPTLAEKRAMRRALEQESEEEKALVKEAERKSLRKRRVMIGAGVTVGVVATVAVWYSAATPEEVSAYCVDDGNTLTTDENICSEEYVRSNGGYVSGGFFFLPIGGGQTRSYHYNYGGSVSGGRVVGGSTAAPSGATVKSGTSGKTIQRGGFGVSGGGKSGGSGTSGGS